MGSNKRPIAVLISDVHYSLKTVFLADTAFRMAIDTAATLKVPLIDCGDLTNDKALLRAEYVNALIKTMDYAIGRGVKVMCLVGNHSKMHEKSKDHALGFLTNQCEIVSHGVINGGFPYMIPYQSEASDFYAMISNIPKGSLVIAHQGMLGGDLGDYVKDSTAVDPRKLRDWRIFTGHYHAHYELENTVSVGNPYTLTFTEANQAPKGFLIVYSDHSFERVLTNLRKHIVLDLDLEGLQLYKDTGSRPKPDDLVWLKVTGARSELDKLNKQAIGAELFGHSNFKFDKIYTDAPKLQVKSDKLTGAEMFDNLIEALPESAEQRSKLKELWRTIV